MIDELHEMGIETIGFHLAADRLEKRELRRNETAGTPREEQRRC